MCGNLTVKLKAINDRRIYLEYLPVFFLSKKLIQTKMTWSKKKILKSNMFSELYHQRDTMETKVNLLHSEYLKNSYKLIRKK